MLSITLSPVSSSEIFTETRDSLELLDSSKEVLDLNVGIAKKHSCCKTSTFFGIKSEELFFPKRNRLCVRIEKATASLNREKNAVLFHASLTNYTLLET